jgi:serine/threonine-protein kinase
MRAKDPYIGAEILNGQFKVLQKIGTGGMGAVYKALQPEMNRLVAVKILHAKLKDRKDLVSRFRREARAMSHLTHPNTVKVMMYGELDGGELYIVMEYLEGRNLNQVVRREGPLTVERAIPILIQVCGALEEAHQLGIIHRDLKPENIFLTNSGGLNDFAKVLDFGLAKVTERELRPGSIMLTQEGMVFGTPEFMSPEQAQGRVLDARSDIYSLAVILYEALTGKLPFDARSPMEFIQLHVTKPPIPIDERVPGRTFPPGLGDVINQALAKSTVDRYATASEFAAALVPYAPAGFQVHLVPMLASRPPPRGDGQGAVAPEAPADDGAEATLQRKPRQGPTASRTGNTLRLGTAPVSQPGLAPAVAVAAGAETDAGAIPASDAPGTRGPSTDVHQAQSAVPSSGAVAPGRTEPPLGRSGVSPRALVIVGALSLIAGVLLTVAALKLFG